MATNSYNTNILQLLLGNKFFTQIFITDSAPMPVKRRNHGRQRKNRGSVNVVQCVQCGAIVPKDKAISRTSNKPVIENATLDDLNVATIYESPEVPTMNITENHCISCACHLRVVRTRNKDSRQERFTLRTRSD